MNWCRGHQRWEHEDCGFGLGLVEALEDFEGHERSPRQPLEDNSHGSAVEALADRLRGMREADEGRAAGGTEAEGEGKDAEARGGPAENTGGNRRAGRGE